MAVETGVAHAPRCSASNVMRLIMPHHFFFLLRPDKHVVLTCTGMCFHYSGSVLERVTIPPTPYCKCKGLVGRHFAAVHQGRLLLFETISLEQLWSIELNSTENIEQDASGEVRIYFSEKSG